MVKLNVQVIRGLLRGKAAELKDLAYYMGIATSALKIILDMPEVDVQYASQMAAYFGVPIIEITAP